MKDRLKAGHPVDVQVCSLSTVMAIGQADICQDLMGRFTLDVSAEFLLGSNLSTLSTPIPYPQGVRGHNAVEADNSVAMQFLNAFRSASDALTGRFRVGPLWPWFEMRKDATDEHMAVVNRYLEPIIDTALERKRLRLPTEGVSKEIEEDDTLLDHLVSMTSGKLSLRS